MIDALAALEKRGLDDGLLDRIQTILAKVDALSKERPQPEIPVETLVRSAQERREAYERLDLWFIDKMILRLRTTTLKFMSNSSSCSNHDPSRTRASPEHGIESRTWLFGPITKGLSSKT